MLPSNQPKLSTILCVLCVLCGGEFGRVMFPDAGWAFTALAATQSKEPPPGRAPYDRVCKVCHGDEGAGNAAPALVPFEMEFEELLARVREGGGEMPPISANRVSDEEVQQIAAYLKLLTPADSSGGR